MNRKFETYVDLLRWRAETHPELNAFSFFVQGNQHQASLNYAELDQRARAFAVLLQSRLKAGQRALLLFPPGLGFIQAFLGCLYGGITPVPAYPPEPHRMAYTLRRLQAIIQDAQTQLVVTTPEIFGLARQLIKSLPDNPMNRLQWLTLDQLEITQAEAWSPPPLSGQDLAFLQYTSGSTAAPKGVMISHANLLHNEAMIKMAFGHGEQENTLVCWVPFYHDMGLVGHLLQSLYVGGQTLIMSPLDFLKKPLRWLQLISEHRATSTGAPNFAFDLCVRKIKPEERDQLDLSSLNLVLNGAEPINHATVERFIRYFEPAGFSRQAFYPAYGMAETTVFISGSKREKRPFYLTLDREALAADRVQPLDADDPQGVTLVSSGQSWMDQEIRIVSPKGHLLAEDRVGEIWISGKHVAQGYWRQPEATREAFQAYLPSGEGPFLRTGDLGFVYQGEIFVTGRLKDMLIIHGRNLYPQDLEREIEQLRSIFPGIRPGCGTVFGIQQDQQEAVVLFQEVIPDAISTPRPLFNQIIDTLSRHFEVAVADIVLLEPGSLPKTSSGKLMRQACKKTYLKGLENSNLAVLARWKTHNESDSDPQNVLKAPASAPPSQMEKPRHAKTRPEIENWLKTFLSAHLNLQGQTLQTDLPLRTYGMDSVLAVELVTSLGEWLGLDLPDTLLWEHETLDALLNYVSPVKHPAPQTEALLTPSPLSPTPSLPPQEPIAIIGVACRFPGASNPDEFWELLRSGQDPLSEIPETRWPNQAYYSPERQPGKTPVQRGGFITQDPGAFDAAFFHISPREAESMDPQQRLLLELSWEALEDAGQDILSLKGSDTGVFMGASSQDYSLRTLYSAPENIDAYAGTGVSLSVMAGRIAYALGLEGPTLAVDTACSSALVALKQACLALQTREATLALVGGINLMLAPELTLYFSQAQALSPEGKCRSFDAKANGYVRSEGGGVAILKPLANAQADGDQIWGVIEASVVRHDGASQGLTAPSGRAQQKGISQALQAAGLTPDDIPYLEAHGTGTPLGDPIELRAAYQVLGQAQSPLIVGAVKSNIGHLEAASGMASLLKVLLCFRHQKIPGNLHFQQLNPAIQLPETAVNIATQLQTWPEKRPRRALINSFGISGTNSHVVVAAPPPVQTREYTGIKPYILPLSAASATSLKTLQTAYLKKLDSQTNPADLAYSAARCRSHLPQRSACIFADIPALKNGLTDQGAGFYTGDFSSPPRLVFVFPGQGGQWVGMGRELLQEPVFAQAISACEQAFAPYVDWSLEAILSQTAEENWQETAVIQPVLFAFQWALAQLLASWGVTPQAVVGHSMGEVAAAAVGGYLNLAEAAQIICERSRLLARLKDQGGMVATDLSAREAEAFCGPDCVIAAHNSPQATVFSGTPEALEKLVNTLQDQGRFARRVQVTVASHSPQVDSLETDLNSALTPLKQNPASPDSPAFYSTVKGQHLSAPDLSKTYWMANLRQPVMFSEAIAELLKADYNCFIEISPHPLLTPMVKAHFSQTHTAPTSLQAIACLRRQESEHAMLRHLLAALYVRGVNLHWATIYPGGRFIPLPHYPWQRQHFLKAPAMRSPEVLAQPQMAQPQKTVLRNEPAYLHWLPQTQTPELSSQSASEPDFGNWLIVPGNHEIAGLLDWMLQAPKRQIFTLHAGSGSQRQGTDFYINPKAPDFEPIIAQVQPRCILWFGFGLETELDETLLILWQLMGALLSNQMRQPTRFYLILTPENRPKLGALKGLFRGFMQQHPECQFATVELEENEAAQQAQSLYQELSQPKKEAEVRWYQGQRLLRRLLPLTHPQTQSAPPEAPTSPAQAGLFQRLFSRKRPTSSPAHLHPPQLRLDPEFTYILMGPEAKVLEHSQRLRHWGLCQQILWSPFETAPNTADWEPGSYQVFSEPIQSSVWPEIGSQFNASQQKVGAIFYLPTPCPEGLEIAALKSAWKTLMTETAIFKNIPLLPGDPTTVVLRPLESVWGASHPFQAVITGWLETLILSHSFHLWLLPAASPDTGMEKQLPLLTQFNSAEFKLPLCLPPLSDKDFQALQSPNLATIFSAYTEVATVSEANSFSLTPSPPSPNVQSVRQQSQPKPVDLSTLPQQIQNQVAAILKLTPAELELTRDLRQYGFDSLMAVELRRELEATFGLTLAGQIIFDLNTIQELATYISQHLAQPGETP